MKRIAVIMVEAEQTGFKKCLFGLCHNDSF